MIYIIYILTIENRKSHDRGTGNLTIETLETGKENHMEHTLLHCCCAPCSLSCTAPLRAEGIEPTALWYNPNIHPWKEYEARRDCLLNYAPTIGMEVRVWEDYGLREFVRAVSGDIGRRCVYC